MSQRFEGHFHGQDHCELFFQIWRVSQPRGTLVVTHGMAEHSECYHALAKELAQDHWEVFGWDLRGHGRSEGKRGYVEHVQVFERDLGQFINTVRSTRLAKQGPLILFGHSMGGMITLRYLENQSQDGIQAAVLSSPALGLAIKVPQWKEQMARLALQWFPTLTLYNEIQYTDLSRDEEMLKHYPTDTLRHDRISPGLFISMIESFEPVIQHAKKITIPLLVQVAGDDRIVNSQATQRFFTELSSPKSELKIYPDSLHEIYNDLERDHVITDLKKFINPLLASKDTSRDV